MQIHAVKDVSGKTVSTFEESSNGVSISPVLKDGEKVETMDVKANYHEHLTDLYKA